MSYHVDPAALSRAGAAAARAAGAQSGLSVDLGRALREVAAQAGSGQASAAAATAARRWSRAGQSWVAEAEALGGGLAAAARAYTAAEQSGAATFRPGS
ncbi:hypothetical protein ACMYYO_10070 [Dermacoccaceae bacterium W4C1]